MKRYLIFPVSLLLLLTACGSVSMTSAPDSETAVEMTVPATQTIPIPTETETESEPLPTTEAETFDLTGAPDPALVGRWTYGFETDSDICFVLSADGSMQLENNMSDTIRLEEDGFYIPYASDQPIPYTVDGDHITASDAQGTWLSLTALPDADPETVQGDFRVEDCLLYPADGNPDKSLTLRIDGASSLLIADGSYTVEGETLTFISAGEVLVQTYYFDQGKLIVIDENGMETALVKVS